MATTTSPGTAARGFSRVVLTSDNIFIPSEKLVNTPSIQDGLDAETEIDLRNYGCELIQTAGILLKLPQVAMATGQVLFQRYYYSRSFVRHNMEITAIAAVHLASKIEEAPRRIRDCLNVFHHMKQVKTGKTIGPMVLDQNYVNIKNEVIKAERRCLKELGFCVHVKHPHKIIVTILDQLEQKHNQRLAQFAWNYMNDSFRTDVFMRFPPSVIACSCIFLAARQLQVPLPNNPPWYHVFDANDDQVREIALALLRLYARTKVNWEKLENAVADAKRRLRDAQVKERLAKDMFANVPSFAEEGNSPQLQLPIETPINLGGDSVQPSQQVAPTPVIAPATQAAEAQQKREDGDQIKSQKKRHRDSKSRSRSRSRSSRRPGKSSSKHRHHSSRRRRHSSTSPGSRDSSRSSTHSSSRSPSSSSGSSHRRSHSKHVSNGHRDSSKSSRKHDSKKYENGDSKRDRNRNNRSGKRSRSRSRSPSRKRDHHRDRSRERSNVRKSSTRDESRRSPPRARNDHHR